MKKIFLILMALLISSCSLLSKLSNSTASLDDLWESNNMKNDKISKGDILNIDIWGEPLLSEQYKVQENGTIIMPLIRDVKVLNKTPDQVSKDIKKLLEQKQITSDVKISILPNASVNYELSGMFSKPGNYKASNRITLLQAIDSNDGFAPFANKNEMLLIRKTRDGDMRYKLDYEKVVNGEEPNPVLFNGDLIEVN